MEQKTFGVIYQIFFPNGKRYIGQTTNIVERIRKYKYLNCKSQTKLFHSLKKYGWDNTVFSILSECADLEELNFMEEWFVSLYQTTKQEHGYNLKSGGFGNGNHCEESKQKMREANLGEKNPNFGKKFSDEHKQKIGEARKDKTLYSLINENMETFTGTQRDFILKYSLDDGNVSSLLKGRAKSVKGWKLAA